MMVKALHQVVNLFKFQLDTITTVPLILMVVLSVGDEIVGMVMSMVQFQISPPISALGTVLNNPTDSTIILLSTKLYFSKTPVGIHNDPLPLPPLMRRAVEQICD